MRQRIHIAGDGAYLHVEVAGEFDNSKVRGLMQEMLNASSERHLQNVLVDIRRVQGPIGVMRQHELARFVVRSQKRPVRLAVVGPDDQDWYDTFFEDVAVNHGGIVKLTTDMEAALSWLNREPAID